MNQPADLGYSFDRRIDALLIADSLADEHAAREAAALVGGRISGHLAWAGVADGLADVATGMVLVEASGVSDVLLEPALPRIDTFARALDLPVVVALDEDQIDMIGAYLLGDRVQLLCRPTTCDRVAAFALAARAPAGMVLDDARRTTETERLRRLNEEVARIAETLSRLAGREPASASPAGASPLLGDRSSSYGGPPAAGEAPDANEVRRAIRSRRLRDQFFQEGLLEDPAWDILLDLFAAHLDHARVSVSSLCIAAAVAPTTALRWIGKMIEFDLLVRHPDPMDRRRAFMALTEKGLRGMQGYVSAARRQGLAIV